MKCERSRNTYANISRIVNRSSGRHSLRMFGLFPSFKYLHIRKYGETINKTVALADQLCFTQRELKQKINYEIAGYGPLSCCAICLDDVAL